MALPARPQKDRRLQLRTTAVEEKLIGVAADRQGVNVTDFILRAARERAEETLAEQTEFVLDGSQWKQFLAALDRPPVEKPRLKKLFSEPHVAKTATVTPEAANMISRLSTAVIVL